MHKLNGTFFQVFSCQVFPLYALQYRYSILHSCQYWLLLSHRSYLLLLFSHSLARNLSDFHHHGNYSPSLNAIWKSIPNQPTKPISFWRISYACASSATLRTSLSLWADSPALTTEALPLLPSLCWLFRYVRSQDVPLCGLMPFFLVATHMHGLVFVRGCAFLIWSLLTQKHPFSSGATISPDY